MSTIPTTPEEILQYRDAWRQSGAYFAILPHASMETARAWCEQNLNEYEYEFLSNPLKAQIGAPGRIEIAGPDEDLWLFELEENAAAFREHMGVSDE